VMGTIGLKLLGPTRSIISNERDRRSIHAN
jgi:hypothetical protein